MNRRNIVILLFALGFVGWFGIKTYEYVIGLQQDRCAFGSTTNVEYREMLQTFKRLRPQLVKQRDEDYGMEVPGVAGENPTISRRLAAMHAFARSQGFLLATVEKSQPLLGNNDAYIVRYEYRQLWPLGVVFACLPGCAFYVFSSFYRQISTGTISKETFKYRTPDFGVGSSIRVPMLTAGPCPTVS